MKPSAARSTRWVTAACVFALGLAACSREADDWRSAQAADTTMSYQQFLHQYPRSAHVNEANTRLAQLAEDEAWQGATSIDTQMGYQQFLTRYPDGKWAQEARVRIENFALTPPSAVAAPAAAPKAAPAPAAPPVPAAVPKPPPAATPPPPAPAKQEPVAKQDAPRKKEAAPKKEPAKPGYGAQLGAFSSRDKAETAWSRLQGQFEAELAGAKHQIVAGQSDAGEVYRLRVPQSGESAARKLCERLKARNEVCVVYRP